jgi:hypothetical protein
MPPKFPRVDYLPEAVHLEAGGKVPLGKPLLEALDRIGYGGLILDAGGEVLVINAAATQILHQNCGRSELPEWSRQALKMLLRSEGAERFRMDEDSWVVIRRLLKRPLILHAVPTAANPSTGPHTVLILVDLEATPRPRPEALPTEPRDGSGHETVRAG